jgi:hypothetical protein
MPLSAVVCNGIGQITDVTAGGARYDIRNNGFRMTQARLLHVPSDEGGQVAAGRTVRYCVQSQLQGPFGVGR